MGHQIILQIWTGELIYVKYFKFSEFNILISVFSFFVDFWYQIILAKLHELFRDKLWKMSNKRKIRPRIKFCSIVYLFTFVFFIVP